MRSYRRSKNTINLLAMAQWSGPAFQGDLRADVEFFLKPGRRTPLNRKTDILNYNKILFDSLQGVCYEDDHQVSEMHFTCHGVEENFSVRILLTELE